MMGSSAHGGRQLEEEMKVPTRKEQESLLRRWFQKIIKERLYLKKVIYLKPKKWRKALLCYISLWGIDVRLRRPNTNDRANLFWQLPNNRAEQAPTYISCILCRYAKKLGLNTRGCYVAAALSILILFLIIVIIAMAACWPGNHHHHHQFILNYPKLPVFQFSHSPALHCSALYPIL